MLNYLYGFVASALTYALLHRLFPAHRVDGFVRDSPSAELLRRQYEEEWEAVAVDDTVGMAVILGRDGGGSAVSTMGGSDIGGDGGVGRRQVGGEMDRKIPEKSAEGRETLV